MTIKSRFNVGVIGYGLSAKVFQIPFITSVATLRLHAVVQRNPTPGNDASKDLPDVKVYRSVEDLLADPSIDLVVVSTSPWTHYSLTKLSLEAGKHVVVEKPFTATTAEADELIEVAKQHNLLLTVYQNRRWDNDFLTVHDVLKKKTLGRVVEFESHFDRFSPDVAQGSISESRPGTGITFDLGVHLVDQALVLFGMPSKVTAFIDHLRDPRTEDSCTILLHYDKLLVTIKATTHSAEEKQLRFWIRGDQGSIKKFHLDIQESQLAAGQKPGSKGFGIEPEENYGILTVAQDGKLVTTVLPNVEPALYTSFYEHVARALAGTGELPVNAGQARDVIRVVELAIESSKLERTIDC